MFSYHEGKLREIRHEREGRELDRKLLIGIGAIVVVSLLTGVHLRPQEEDSCPSCPCPELITPTPEVSQIETSLDLGLF